MTILVTGATGFLGSHLALALRDYGVVATGRSPAALARLASKGIKAQKLDLAQSVPRALRDRVGPVDAIVHCAGLSSPWGRDRDFVQGNVDATRHLADLAAELGVRRFVLVSTASVYFRFADQEGLMEDTPLPSPVNAYARTKRAAEVAVLDRPDIGPVILRPRGIYGADDTALLPRLMRVAARRSVPRFHPAGATDITHVDDVVAAIRAALEATPAVNGQIINISGGVGLSLPEIITAACEQTQVALRWRDLPFAPTMAAVRLLEAGAKCLPGRPEPPVTAYALGLLRFRQTLNISKAERLLGWRPQVSFEEGLQRTFKDGALREGVL